MHPITYCPPGPSTVHFDLRQFDMKPNHPVTARYTGHGEWESTGISFQDYGSMATMTRKLESTRRFKVPTWAVNDGDLQSVLVTYLENRVFSRAQRRLCARRSLKNRLRNAEAALQARVPAQEKVLESLCSQYCSAKQAGVSEQALSVLVAEIEGLDTQIIINRSPARVVAAIVYGYYREGKNSVTVAGAVGLRSPCVRQILFKIWAAARQLGFPEPEREQQRKHDTPEERQQRRDARNAERAARKAERLVAREARKEQRTQSHAQATARRHARRRDAGLCPHCGMVPEDGFKLCAAVRKRNRDRKSRASA
jgi:hypothetical protein